MQNNTILIEVINQKARRLLSELEELKLIKVVKENCGIQTKRLSEKYNGIISREQGEKLNQHIKRMRSEWNNT